MAGEKQLIREEDVTYTFYREGQKVTEKHLVLIYEDQPRLTEEQVIQIFKMNPFIHELHELSETHGGRWTRPQEKTEQLTLF